MVFVDLGGQKLCLLFVKVIWGCPVCPAGSPRADPAIVVCSLGCGVCTGLGVGFSRVRSFVLCGTRLLPSLVTVGCEDPGDEGRRLQRDVVLCVWDCAPFLWS